MGKETGVVGQKMMMWGQVKHLQLLSRQCIIERIGRIDQSCSGDSSTLVDVVMLETVIVMVSIEEEDLDHYLVYLRDTWSYNITINTHCKHKFIRQIESVLDSCGELDEFRSSCFGHYLDLPVGGYFQAQYMHNLFLRQITPPGASNNEMWFGLGKTKVRFGAREFCLCTGLKFGELTDIFSRVYEHVTDDERTQVSYWIMTLAEDTNDFNMFAWGHFVFKMTLHYIRQGFRMPDPTGPTCRYNLYGFVWGVQFWAMEAIPVMRHKLGHYLGSGYPRFKKIDFITKASKMRETWLEMELEGNLTGRQELTPTKCESKQDYWVDVDVDMSIGPQFEPSVLIGANEGVAEPIRNNVGKKRKRQYKGPDVPAQRRQRRQQVESRHGMIPHLIFLKNRLLPLEEIAKFWSEGFEHVRGFQSDHDCMNEQDHGDKDNEDLFDTNWNMDYNGDRSGKNGDTQPETSATVPQPVITETAPSFRPTTTEAVPQPTIPGSATSPQPSTTESPSTPSPATTETTITPQPAILVITSSPHSTTTETTRSPKQTNKPLPVSTTKQTTTAHEPATTHSTHSPQPATSAALTPPHPKIMDPTDVVRDRLRRQNRKTDPMGQYKAFKASKKDQYRKVGIEACVTLTFFKTLEDPNEWLSNEHVDAYINVLYKRKNDPSVGENFSKHVVVLDCNFFILVPCRVDIGHWVLCKVNLLTWVITIFDSTAYLKPTDGKFREEQVLPLRRLFPLICNQSGYYEVSKRAPRRPLDCMKAIRLSPRQFPQQHDGTSCGIFMLQGIENIIRNKDQQWNWSKDTVPGLRKDMAFEIFGCSLEED
ncbi:hypothetical protein Ddye_020883 [Dipteronia dyeriana]|uniref:Ubiquitin-like protease family profile domain-containing protein n=1 Tax=Dipteronia dyeriana TaxID=168575 RepID=A0AAD9U109_9ROSI|nr:hypothetical protein Ddye_020883 [Dipteronia dyeriana]